MVAAAVLLDRTPMFFSRVKLNSNAVATAFPPDLVDGLVLLEDADSGNQWLKETDDTTGLAVWKPNGNPAASEFGAYAVNVAGQQPVVRFTSVQAAMDQAKADGHNAANPATVFILGGSYTENLVLRDGIDLATFGGRAHEDPAGTPTATGTTNWFPDVQITGNVTLEAGFTRCTIDGVDLLGTVNFGVNPTMTGFTARSCLIGANSAGAFAVTGGPTGSPQVNFEDCQILNTNATGKGVGFTAAVVLTMLACSSSTATGNQPALSMTGGTRHLQDVKLNGSLVDLAAITTAVANDTDIAVSGISPVTLFLGSTTTHTGGSMTGGTAGSTIVGTGTITLNQVKSDGNGIGIAATVTATTSGSHRPFVELKVGAAAKTMASGVLDFDLALFDTTAAGRTCTLPPLATVPLGTPVNVGMQISGANAITVAPNGAELINSTNASVLSSATLLGAVRVIRGSTSWWVTARS